MARLRVRAHLPLSAELGDEDDDEDGEDSGSDDDDEAPRDAGKHPSPPTAASWLAR